MAGGTLGLLPFGGRFYILAGACMALCSSLEIDTPASHFTNQQNQRFSRNTLHHPKRRIFHRNYPQSSKRSGRMWTFAGGGEDGIPPGPSSSSSLTSSAPKPIPTNPSPSSSVAVPIEKSSSSVTSSSWLSTWTKERFAVVSQCVSQRVNELQRKLIIPQTPACVDAIHGFIDRHWRRITIWGLVYSLATPIVSHFGLNLQFQTTRMLVLQGLALSYLLAFISMKRQLKGLISNDGGILSSDIFVARWRSNVERVLEQPKKDEDTAAGPAAVESGGVPSTAIVLSLASFLAPLKAFAFLQHTYLCIEIQQCEERVIYLNLTDVTEQFTNLQWDVLLLEAGAIASLLALPGGTLLATSLALWNIRALAFKVMFASGVVKLESQCPKWRTLTAMDYHYETQPLPHKLSWFAHGAPSWAQSYTALGTFVAELGLPLLYMTPLPKLWSAGFIGTVALMFSIILTGNYGFFNWLTIALSLSLLPDNKRLEGQVGELLSCFGSRLGGAVDLLRHSCSAVASCASSKLAYLASSSSSWIPPSVHRTFPTLLCPSSSADSVAAAATAMRAVPAAAAAPFLSTPLGTVASKIGAALTQYQEVAMPLAWKVAHLALTAFFAPWIYAAIVAPIFRLNDQAPPDILAGFLESSSRLLRPFNVGHSYGLFASMTTFRWELIVEGSNDGKHWKEYVFKYKPSGLVTRPPPFAPLGHMPRLDWMLWFIPLRLYRGGFLPDVLSLISENPFPEAPPKYISVSLYDYHLTSKRNYMDIDDQTMMSGDDETRALAEALAEITSPPSNGGSNATSAVDERTSAKAPPAKEWWHRRKIEKLLTLTLDNEGEIQRVEDP
eukprot:jgi/Bigna1/79228/fgenesh1_pg.60_\